MLQKFFFLVLVVLASYGCSKYKCDENNSIETQPPLLSANALEGNNMVRGYFSALPAHYSKTSKVYPLILFLHGGGQVGNGRSDLNKVLVEGLPEILKDKRFPPNFVREGRNFSFIVLAPQFKGFPDNTDVISFLSFAKQKYRIDTTRIYLSGLSSGGILTCDVSAENPKTFAAIVPMSGVSIWPSLNDKAKSLAEKNLPVWAFHNDGDSTISISAAEYFIQLINSFHPAITARLTKLLPWGYNNHDSWTVATDPLYKENGMNIYEWMLQFHR